MRAGAYFIGRTEGTIEHPYNGTSRLYSSQLLDGATLDKPTYEHCTFANISFKETKMKGGHFANCAFVACYFRNADIRNCSFSSCRFIDCEFPKTAFSGCDFRYTRFAGCYIPFDEIEHSLPTEPNLREQIAHNLARESAALGDSRNARAYRLCQVKAREAHYVAAFRANSKWYKDHYDGLARLTAFVRYTGSILNRVLFGYGERLRVVLRNFVLATLVVFPILFYIVPGDLLMPSDVTDVSATQPSLLAVLEFSLSNAVAGALRSPIHLSGFAVRMVAAFQIFLTAIWASLVAGYVFRWSLQR